MSKIVLEGIKKGGFKKSEAIFRSSGFSRKFETWNLVKNRILYGEKPHFSPSACPIQNAKTMRQIEDYHKWWKDTQDGAKEFVVDVAKDITKDYVKEGIAALVLLIAYLTLSEDEADKQLKILELEKGELIAQVKAAKASKEDEQAMLDEVQKQYVTWTDWWNNTNGAKQLEIKSEITKLESQMSRLDVQLVAKQKNIDALKSTIQAHKERKMELVVIGT